jgi:sugar-specific transcriptional regulator TrmB
MRDAPPEDPQSVAIEQLERFGLSTYAARTFVALTGLGTSTAREVSEVSRVPRTRVYDAAEELRDRGFVDVRQSSPRRFRPVSADTASHRFADELTRRADALRTALGELEPGVRRVEQRGIWTAGGREAVVERVVELVESAESRVVYVSVTDDPAPDVVDALAAAVARGVDVDLAGADVPGARTFESPWDPSAAAAGRLALIDGRTALVSARNATAEPPSETAVWGSDETNALVVVLRALFG